jgi:predicted dehydrogenase
MMLGLPSKMALSKTICALDSEVIQKVGTQIKGAQDRQPGSVKDYRHVLDDEEVDGAFVATPDHWHAISLTRCQGVGHREICEHHPS